MRGMRRCGQALPEDEAAEILRRGKVCTLALAGDDGYPYAVPLNYVYDGTSVYVHSAREGHKIDALRRSEKCSLCVVDADEVVPERFTTYFRSAIAFGRAGIVEDDAERLRALRLLSEKYAPGVDPSEELRRFFAAVCVIRITIEALSGKEAVELRRPSAERV